MEDVSEAGGEEEEGEEIGRNRGFPPVYTFVRILMRPVCSFFLRSFNMALERRRTPNKLTAAWNEGQYQAYAGMEKSNNPYKTKRERAAYFQGFRAAEIHLRIRAKRVK